MRSDGESDAILSKGLLNRRAFQSQISSRDAWVLSRRIRTATGFKTQDALGRLSSTVSDALDRASVQIEPLDYATT